MSFLAKILGQIDGSKSTASTPSAPPPTSSASQKASDAASNGTASNKRKAQNELATAANKLRRKEDKGTSDAPPARAAQTDSVKPQPYRGTAGTVTGTVTGAAKPSSRPPLKTTALPKPPSSPVSASPVVGKAPTKGSYAEILARGKASQPKDIMKISNKKATEPTLQRNRDRKKMLERDRLNGGDRDVQSAGEGGDTAGPKKNRPEYVGNARASSAAPASNSARPVYAGTAGLKHGRTSGGPERKDKARYAGNASWDENDEDVEDDYGSDESSDMEANVFDVDQEEEFSTRAARKEDAEELAKLSELDREKRLRKLKLEKMAAEKRNKKRVL